LNALRLKQISGRTYALENTHTLKNAHVIKNAHSLENAHAPAWTESRAKTEPTPAYAAGIGLYLFSDRQCLLIDSGANSTQAQALLRILTEKGWTICGIFNTHAHADHCGGNHFLQKMSGCRIYASAIEAAFLQQPLLNPYVLYGAYPLKLLQNKYNQALDSPASDIRYAEPGPLTINGEDFEILNLGGHTLGHLGLRTPDNVLFVGDSLIAPEILRANPFLYLADPGQQLDTLAKLKTDKASLLYLSHGGLSDQVSALVSINQAMLFSLMDLIKQIIQFPRSRETIIQEVITRQGLQVNRQHYFRLAASVSALLAHLCNENQADALMQENCLKYCAKGRLKGISKFGETSA
jgi:glyoxylase-like metal-dependent hydrolase (beta-lactamase superfamily II)